MSLHRYTSSERVITHGVLVAGAIVFAFPFAWMLSTSVKLRREMAAENLRLTPLAPQPREASPYIDSAEFRMPACLDGIPKAVWEVAQPRLVDLLGRRIDAWAPQTVGPEKNAPPAPVDPAAYREAMVNGLMKTLAGRISDVARQAAVEAEKRYRESQERRGLSSPRSGPQPSSREASSEISGRTERKERPGQSETLAQTGKPAPRMAGAQASDAAMAGRLSPAAIEEGTRAILADAGRLVDEQLLRETFDACYRRFCLGPVRILGQDYQSYSLYTGKEWKVAAGAAELAGRVEKALPAQEVRLRFSRGEPSASFHFEAPLPIPASTIDRVYAGYRGDAAWARVYFQVIRDGKVYRTEDQLNLHERDWVEQELRWPRDDVDPMARRPYMLLHDAGAAPPGSPAFAVDMTVRKVSAPAAWLAKLTLNYRQAFREANLTRYIMTSFALALLNITLAIFSCSLAGYAFARLTWPGRNMFFGLLLATMMIPGQVTMIPNFLVHRALGWYNTLLPLWVHSTFGSAFFIFLLRQFFKNVPSDLEDAARIDGCGFLRIYWHVMLPLVKPTLATIAIFTFMGVWNNFMGPLIYVNDERLFPLALGMFKFSLSSGADVGLMMAGSFIMTLPIITLFFFVQRYFIQGVSLTGMKG